MPLMKFSSDLSLKYTLLKDILLQAVLMIFEKL